MALARRIIHGAVLSGLIVAVGCAEARTDKMGHGAVCLDYSADVEPVLAASCGSCHGTTQQDGSYSVATLADLFARDDNGVARMVPGDQNSPFLAKARGEGGHPEASQTDIDLLTEWTVTCQASTLTNDLVHPTGLLNLASPDFHGTRLRNSGWDFAQCEQCHGPVDDPSGGASGKSCVECHANAKGPTSCNTCHGSTVSAAPPVSLNHETSTATPGVGAHRLHVKGGPILGQAIECSACHTTPNDWRDPGHVFLADGSIDPPPAEVFSGSGSAGFAGLGAERGAQPAYDAQTNTCSNTYCHGGGGNLPSDTTSSIQRTLNWLSPDTTNETCDSCHGLPPKTPSHPDFPGVENCYFCHSLTVNPDGSIRTFPDGSTLHLNGKVDL